MNHQRLQTSLMTCIEENNVIGIINTLYRIGSRGRDRLDIFGLVTRAIELGHMESFAALNIFDNIVSNALDYTTGNIKVLVLMRAIKHLDMAKDTYYIDFISSVLGESLMFRSRDVLPHISSIFAVRWLYRSSRLLPWEFLNELLYTNNITAMADHARHHDISDSYKFPSSIRVHSGNSDHWMAWVWFYKHYPSWFPDNEETRKRCIYYTQCLDVNHKFSVLPLQLARELGQLVVEFLIGK
jgi:hypothetical protein